MTDQVKTIQTRLSRKKVKLSRAEIQKLADFSQALTKEELDHIEEKVLQSIQKTSINEESMKNITPPESSIEGQLTKLPKNELLIVKQAELLSIELSYTDIQDISTSIDQEDSLDTGAIKQAIKFWVKQKQEEEKKQTIEFLNEITEVTQKGQEETEELIIDSLSGLLKNRAKRRNNFINAVKNQFKTPG